MKLSIKHNLDDVQLEEALEKALNGLRRYIEEPDRALPDALAERIRDEANGSFDNIIEHMLSEIKAVIERKG